MITIKCNRTNDYLKAVKFNPDIKNRLHLITLGSEETENLNLALRTYRAFSSTEGRKPVEFTSELEGMNEVILTTDYVPEMLNILCLYEVISPENYQETLTAYEESCADSITTRFGCS